MQHIDGIEIVIDDFKTLINQFRSKGHDLLDFTSTAFERDFVEFTMNNSGLENRIQVSSRSCDLSARPNSLRCVKSQLNFGFLEQFPIFEGGWCGAGGGEVVHHWGEDGVCRWVSVFFSVRVVWGGLRNPFAILTDTVPAPPKIHTHPHATMTLRSRRWGGFPRRSRVCRRVVAVRMVWLGDECLWVDVLVLGVYG